MKIRREVMSQEIEEKMLQVYKEYQEGFDNSSDNFPESAKLDNFGYDDYSDYYCDFFFCFLVFFFICAFQN